MKKTSLIIALAGISLLLLGSNLQAEEQDQEQASEKRLLADELVQELKSTEAVEERAEYKFTYGGWITSLFREYKNLDNDDAEDDWVKNSWLNEIRLWAKLVSPHQDMLYVRMRNSYTTRSTGQGYNGVGDDNDGPHLDMGYLLLTRKFSDALDASVKVGRQYLKSGRGIVYSDTHDAVKINATIKDSYSLQVFAARTPPHEENIDYSVPGYQKGSKRFFYGAELAYLKFKGFAPYILALIERDHSAERPEDASKEFDYDAEYYALGTVGWVSPQFKYWAEIIKQNGKSYTDPEHAMVLEKRDIDAWGYNVGLRYYLNTRFQPSLELETAFGSGDKDRLRVTNTTDGNISGDDTNFHYFGSFYGGYALSPRLSNLYIYKADLSFNPLEKFKLFKKFALGVKFFLYRKDEKTGRIYDTDATENSLDIGKEIDVYLYWKINPSWLIISRFGVFYPGQAYPDSANETSKYAYLRTTISF